MVFQILEGLRLFISLKALKQPTVLHKLVFLLPVYHVTVCGGIGYLVVFSGPESWRGFRLKDSFKVCRSLTKLNWTSVVSVRELDLVLKMEMRLPKS